MFMIHLGSNVVM